MCRLILSKLLPLKSSTRSGGPGQRSQFAPYQSMTLAMTTFGNKNSAAMTFSASVVCALV